MVANNAGWNANVYQQIDMVFNNSLLDSGIVHATVSSIMWLVDGIYISIYNILWYEWRMNSIWTFITCIFKIKLLLLFKKLMFLTIFFLFDYEQILLTVDFINTYEGNIR